MKIIHFITSIDSADIYPAEYMSALLRCMGTAAEVHLATFRSADIPSVAPATLHLFDYPKNIASRSFSREFEQLIDALRPDIIHIHGCWDRSLWDVTQIAKAADVPLVLSPHGALEPAILKTFFLTRRLPRLVAYQYRTALNADVLLSSTKTEEENLRDLLWNRHIAVIPDPRLTPGVNYGEVSESLLALYRKTIDSTCHYRSLEETEKEVVKALLREGTAHTDEPVQTPEETVAAMLQLSDKAWRKLLIIAHDNHVENTFSDGAVRLGIKIPMIDMQHIDRFDHLTKDVPTTLPTDKLLYLNPLQKSKLNDIEDAKVKRLVILLLNTRHLVGKEDVNLGHLAQLYKYMKYENYDEDIFTESLKPFRLKSFVERTEMVLNHFFGLTEGFMPIPACTLKQAQPLIDKTTKIL